MSEGLTLCAVFAHPDDESFGVAGTLARAATVGVHTALICATRGEAGMSGGLADTAEALAHVRAAELACAAQVMGLSELEVFDFADGGGETWDASALDAGILAELRRLRPEVLVTFDPLGVTRHPDHIAVHQATRRLVEAHGLALGVKRLYYQVVTCEAEASPEGPSLACVGCDEVDISVDISDFEPVKRAALRCHRTQAADTAHFLDQPEGSLLQEHYQLAWASDGWRPQPGERDLFAGLNKT